MKATKTVKIPKALETKVQQFLYLDAQIKAADAEKEALKEQIVSEATRYPELFDNGALVMKSGVIKEAFNPPSVTYGNGEILPPADRIGLALELGPEFTKTDVNATRLYEKVKQGNRDVKSILEKHGVYCARVKRFDIKPL